MNTYDAVLFIGFGGPEKREDIRPFLERVTRGRSIPPERLEEVAHHYEAIGGSSPINRITRSQAEALERELAAQGQPMKVYIGQRYSRPFLEDTLRRMTEGGVKRAVGFPTTAHRSEASWERYLLAVEEARRRVGGSAPSFDYVGSWFDHPLFIDAICERIKEAAAPSQAAWLFTAHSIPVPMAKDSRYVQELERTAALTAGRFERKEWKLAYTSRSGRPQDPWLEPDVSDAIREAARCGITDVLCIPIGFIADHVEVLYDLGVEAREKAASLGVRLFRAPTVGTHPLFIKMMADAIRKTAVVGTS